jgi:hypothetical protein
MSLGLFPFAFSLVAEFGVLNLKLEEEFSTIYKLLPSVFESALDVKSASRTSFTFALTVLFLSSLPLVFATLFAPKRKLMPYRVIWCVAVYASVILINLAGFLAYSDVGLWPMLLLIPLTAVADSACQVLCRTSEHSFGLSAHSSTDNSPLIDSRVS